MIELPLILLAGVLGSAHCVGMCGGFALAIGGGARGILANLTRQALYTLGRLFTYGALGLAAAYGGARLAQVAPSLVNVPALLSLAAGAILVYLGLAASGLLQKRGVAGNGACLAGTFLGTFLRSPGSAPVFLAGVITGFLPCGLLYGMLALAAATSNLWWGAGTMLVFGLGTAPVMILTGFGGAALSLAARRKLYSFAAWSVVATGAISIARGIAFLTLWSGGAECPMCH